MVVWLLLFFEEEVNVSAANHFYNATSVASQSYTLWDISPSTRSSLALSSVYVMIPGETSAGRYKLVSRMLRCIKGQFCRTEVKTGRVPNVGD